MRKKAAPTLEHRLASADADAMAALEVFEQAAEDLDNAAAAAAEVKKEAEAEVQRLTALRDSAYRTEVAYGAKATKIREFFQ